MIGKGKSIKHTSIAVDYARLKEQGEELGRRNLAGETGAEIEKEFKLCQDLNHRCENNTLQFIISPTIEDGKKLKTSDLREIYGDFINKMNLEGNQSIAFVHRDREHTHLHIYANRINFEGKAFDDAFISNRSAHLAEEIAQERGLTTAREVQQNKLESTKDVREEIQKRHAKAMESRPKNMEEYSKLMKGQGVNVDIVKSEKTGKVSGLRFEFEGNTLKGSEVARKMSFEGILKEINQPIKIVSKIVQKGQNLGM